MQERVGASEGRYGVPTPPGGGRLRGWRESQSEPPRGPPLLAATVSPHLPLPQTGMSWTSKVAVEAVFHILIMDALHRTHGK